GGKWSMDIQQATTVVYNSDWLDRLKNAIHLNAMDYLLLHCDYGHFIGRAVNNFIDENGLWHKVDMIASHGHTTFHMPLRQMTGQLGDGAAIAAETGLPVISDLRALDIAFGGQGAPIVPIGEKLLLAEYEFLLNLGGIANLSFRHNGHYYAYDVCPANRVLNMLVQPLKLNMDADGALAAGGRSFAPLLQRLEALDYYGLPYPKSLSNDFGTDVVYPLVKSAGLPVPDALRTFVDHIALQIRKEIGMLGEKEKLPVRGQRLLVTGGGALNSFLVQRIAEELAEIGVTLVVPEKKLIEYKEAVVMALIGVLRWREEYNVLHTVTGASRDSIGGALWLGTEA
ncbi:MAG: anhydro-N-acetylmuramic acid kinase, partial [Flavihumibacter sp.]